MKRFIEFNDNLKQSLLPTSKQPSVWPLVSEREYEEDFENFMSDFKSEAEIFMNENNLRFELYTTLYDRMELGVVVYDSLSNSEPVFYSRLFVDNFIRYHDLTLWYFDSPQVKKTHANLGIGTQAYAFAVNICDLDLITTDSQTGPARRVWQKLINYVPNMYLLSENNNDTSKDTHKIIKKLTSQPEIEYLYKNPQKQYQILATRFNLL